MKKFNQVVLTVLVLGAVFATMPNIASAQPVLPATDVQSAQEYASACESDRLAGEASAADRWLISGKQAEKIQGLRKALARGLPAGANAEIVAAYREFLQAKLKYEENVPTEWAFIVYGGLGGAAVVLDAMGGCGLAFGTVYVVAQAHDQGVANLQAKADRAAQDARTIASKYGVVLFR